MAALLFTSFPYLHPAALQHSPSINFPVSPVSPDPIFCFAATHSYTQNATIPLGLVCLSRFMLFLIQRLCQPPLLQQAVPYGAALGCQKYATGNTMEHVSAGASSSHVQHAHRHFC